MGVVGFDFKNPDYVSVAKARFDALQRIRDAGDSAVEDLKAYYRDGHVADFIEDWGVTYDPRNVEPGVESNLPAMMPFVLFPKQREYVEWVLDLWRRRVSGLVEKSRDGGISWLDVAIACSLGVLYDGFRGGMGSRVADYVDKVGEPKSLFWKARYFMDKLPVEFRAGYVEAIHSPYMRMMFPETGSTLVGEAGDEIGRGDRAQPLDATVLTPAGPRRMGDLKVGDRVTSSDGTPTLVVGVYPQGLKPIYRVTFSDGASTECCGDHLWRITTSANRKTRKAKKPRAPTHQVRRLDDFRGDLWKVQHGRREARFQIPVLSAPAVFDQTEPAPLDPYLVGALLGDGAVSQRGTTPGFTTADAEMVGLLQATLPVHCAVVSDGSKFGYRLSDQRGKLGRGHRSPIKEGLDHLGLAGTKSHTKFIPDVYKFGSPEDRLALIQGLLDTDGWIRSRKSKKAAPQVCFVSTSRRLVDDLKFVVQSLGGLAYESAKIESGARKFPDGVVRKTREAFVLTLKMPAGMVPFRLSRKASKYKDRTVYRLPTRSIVKVESAGFKQTQCIRVDADDHLYVTDHCIVTHNTSLYFNDEYAHHPQARKVDAALSMTTNCRIDVSSVNGMNNPFAEKRHSGRVPVFVFDWRDDPRKDQAWYDKQSATLDPVVLAQEVDRDYMASVDGVLIPGDWIRSAIGAREKLGLPLTGEKRLAFDVADEGKDKNGVAAAVGIEITHADEWSGKGIDIFASTQKVVDVCDDLDVEGFRYDADGVGADVRGSIRIINDARRAHGLPLITIQAFRGSDEVFDPEGIVVGGGLSMREGGTPRLNKDFYANRKAQGWWELRQRFRRVHIWLTKGIEAKADEIVSLDPKMPMLTKVMSELGQPTFSTNGAGKIVVNKMPPGMKSPNLGDPIMYVLARIEAGHIPITGETLRQVRSGVPSGMFGKSRARNPRLYRR